MKRKFLLLVMMCLLGGLSSSLMAQTTVTINGKVGNWTENANANAPLNANNTYTLSQQIYLAEELVNVSSGSTFSSIAFRLNILGVTPCSRDIKIYIANTTESSFPITKYRYKMNSSDLVYEGTITLTQDQIDNNGGWVEIVFNKSTFKYEGGNILLCVWDHTGSKCGKATSFKTYKDTKFGSNSKLIIRNIYRTATNIDPTSEEYLTTSFSTPSSNYNALPQVKFTYTSGGVTTDKPVFSDPDISSNYYPAHNATDVFNPFFRFVATNTSHYKILVGTNEDVTEGVKYIKGGEESWETKDVETNEVTTGNYSDLEANKTYYWKVIAKNVDLNGESEEVESDTFTFTTAATAEPGQLESCSPASETVCYDGYPELKWEYGANSAQYQLLLGDTEDLTEKNHLKVSWSTAYASGNSYQTSGLAVGTYYWQVNVKNGNYITEGEVYSFTIPEVENISNATADVNNKVLSWTFAEGTSQYKVLLGRATTENPEHPYEFLTQHQTEWMDATGKNGTFTLPTNDIVAGATYYWAVDVKNYADQKIYFNMIKDRTPIKNENGDITGWEPAVYEHQVEVYSFVTSDMAAAENYSPKDNTLNLENPELKWNFNGNAAVEYKVFLGTDATDLKAETEEWLKRETVATGLAGQGSYQTENLTPATKYFWRVDVRDANENEVKGTVWSFGTILPKPEVSADPEQVMPELGNYGSTTITWNTIETAQGYNVYLRNDKGETQLNEVLITNPKNYFVVEASSGVLTYNMGEGHNFYVEAVYGELGKAKSENPANVKVSGKSSFSGIVYSSNYSTRLADAKVTLTFVEDEFGRTVDGTKYTTEYTYYTNSSGQLYEKQTVNGNPSTVTNFSHHNGLYDVTIEADYHTTHTGSIEIVNGGSSLSQILTPDQKYIFDVNLSNISYNSVNVNLENSNWEDSGEVDSEGLPIPYNAAGRYHVYLKKGEEIIYLGERDFVKINEQATAVYFEYKGWSELGKGSYKFGVAKDKDKVNWSAAENIDYDVFEVEGDWNTAANWRDGVPSATAKVYLLAPATISAEEEVIAGTVNIEQGGSLTINGSLTAGAVYNNTLLSAMQINDGGQLRQSNQNLKGKFVMTVTPPTSWDESNIDGWQFIASPVEGVEFSNFIPANAVEGDYDLYQYDGDNDLWRNHKHVYDVNEVGYEFGSEFVLGTAYLAALQYSKDVIFSGTFNAATTHQFEVSYTPDNRAANFHLLGNPFTFDINTANFQAAGLADGYAVMNEDGDDYDYFIEGTIPVGDGFFVFATGDPASLSYVETRGAKEATDNINIVARGEAGSNNVIINFAEGESFRKLEGFNKEIANIYVANNGNKYAIYNCESNVNEVELTFVAKQMGSYSLSFDLNGEFESVVLVDRLTGAETDMMVEDEYNFIATSEDMKNRFVVRFANGQEPTANASFVYQSGDELIIDTEGAIEIIDMMGRVVYSSDVKVNRVNVSNFNNAAYVVRALNEGKVQKVVIY